VATLAQEALPAMGDGLGLLPTMEQKGRLAADTGHAAGTLTAKKREAQTSDGGKYGPPERQDHGDKRDQGL
jgi:hypothetical protein